MMNNMTPTPKFDKLIAKAIKNGHDVKIIKQNLSKDSLYSHNITASVGTQCLANVTVIGNNPKTENLVKNKRFKI